MRAFPDHSLGTCARLFFHLISTYWPLSCGSDTVQTRQIVWESHVGSAPSCSAVLTDPIAHLRNGGRVCILSEGEVPAMWRGSMFRGEREEKAGK